METIYGYDAGRPCSVQGLTLYGLTYLHETNPHYLFISPAITYKVTIITDNLVKVSITRNANADSVLSPPRILKYL